MYWEKPLLKTFCVNSYLYSQKKATRCSPSHLGQACRENYNTWVAAKITIYG